MSMLTTEDALRACVLCPHHCGVNRGAGALGYCRAGAVPRVYRYGPHFGEEPPITGEHGSGTIFFSHCTMQCLYCQNHTWSQANAGDDLTVDKLSSIFRELAAQGCHNWNLVSPTPWLPLIRDAVAPVIASGTRLPFVYNTSGYESVETLKQFSDLIDIAQIDLRYAHADTAAEGSGCRDYVEVARAAIAHLWETLGPLQCDEADIAHRGVICRLLALPGREDEVVENLRWLKRHVGTEIHVSVMAQYMPVYKALSKPGWDRKIRPEDYQRIIDAIDELGFDNGWVQACEEETAEQMLGQDMTPGLGAVTS